MLAGSQDSIDPEILQWLFHSRDLYSMVCTLVLGKTSRKDLTKEAVTSEKLVRQTLKNLNQLLLFKTYLVGEQVTVADITMCLTILPVFHMDKESFKASYVNLNRWIKTLINQPKFKFIL